jgi:two-component system KDP operon response regulator KdpE
VSDRVLVVDDERAILRTLGANLEARGYDVELAATGDEALTSLRTRHPDVVVLDLGLPDLPGLEVLRRLRGWSDVPVLVLTARDTEADKVDALDAGADDYVTKPFAIAELLARLRALLRWSAPPSGTYVIETPDFVLDVAMRTATRHGEPVHLTPTEWDVVTRLARRTGRLVPQRTLLAEVWGDDETQRDAALLRVHLRQIRRKLEPEPGRPKYFLTEPGLGYRFVAGD